MWFRSDSMVASQSYIHVKYEKLEDKSFDKQIYSVDLSSFREDNKEDLSLSEKIYLRAVPQKMEDIYCTKEDISFNSVMGLEAIYDAFWEEDLSSHGSKDHWLPIAYRKVLYDNESIVGVVV